jgi:hypothetical protein
MSGSIKTISIALISNKPFETKGDPPILQFVTVRAVDGECIEGMSTLKEKASLFAKIKALDSTLTEAWMQRWQGQFEERGEGLGTTVILIGLRCIKAPATWRMFAKDADLLVHTIRQPGDEVLFTGSLQRRNVPAPLDYSLRALLSMMFKDKPKLETIELFGTNVECGDYANQLVEMDRTKTIRVPGKTGTPAHDVAVLLGCNHTQAHDTGHYGIHIYCEGTLIAAFVQHDLKLAAISKGDHFGAVMIIDFNKATGIHPYNNKINMHFEQNNEVWNSVKNIFEQYLDTRIQARDNVFPYRKPFAACIQRLEDIFKEEYGVDGNNQPRQGPVRGILRIPTFETQDSSITTYTQFASKDGRAVLSFTEIKKKIANNKYADILSTAVQEFARDVERVLTCAINWHANGRFIPDTVDHLDPNDCTAADIEAAQALTHTTPKSANDTTKGKHLFTLEDIFEEKKIPKEFLGTTVQENKSSFPGLTATSEVAYNTSFLLPHRQDVAAVTFCNYLQQQLDINIAGMTEDFESTAHTTAGGADDNLVQCADCDQWRKVPGAAHAKYKPKTAVFRCEMEQRNCTEPCDATADDVVVGPADENGDEVEPGDDDANDDFEEDADENEEDADTEDEDEDEDADDVMEHDEEDDKNNGSKTNQGDGDAEAGEEGEEGKADHAEDADNQVVVNSRQKQPTSFDTVDKLDQLVTNCSTTGNQPMKMQKLAKFVGGHRFTEVDKTGMVNYFQENKEVILMIKGHAKNDPNLKHVWKQIKESVKKWDLKGAAQEQESTPSAALAPTSAAHATRVSALTQEPVSGLSVFGNAAYTGPVGSPRAPVVPKELAPSSIEHHPRLVTSCARALGISEQTFADLPPCEKRAGLGCKCHQTWVDFARGHPTDARRLKTEINKRKAVMPGMERRGSKTLFPGSDAGSGGEVVCTDDV